MINKLTVSFEDFNKLVWTIDVPMDSEELPYNLSHVFAKIIKESDANKDTLLEELKYELQTDN